ncbi:MAG: hypothetical protein GTO30_06915, partial [Acidobacteria bacterium]|nr:hypothetical protein [Acidobacteriota bacterium]
MREGGDWLEAARARGGSRYDMVWAHPVYPTWEYEMVVPAGRWLVRPESDGLERADPREVEVDLRPGDYERVDFVVDGGHGRGGGRRTRVRVEDVQRDRVREATVEAWPAHPDVREDGPIAAAKTGWSDAILRGLGDEEYLFVAGKRGYVEAGKVAKAPVPGEKNGGVRLRLGRGAVVHAVARGADEKAVAGVEVVLERQDDFVSLLADREIADWVVRPTGATDKSGHLWMRGIYPGLYRLTGAHRRSGEAMFFAEFRDKGESRWEREFEKEYRGDEEDELEIRLVPAGVLRARLHCSDGSELAPEADLAIHDGLQTHDPGKAWNEAVYKAEAYVLEGQRRDTFHVGPLDPGAYR